MHKLDGLSLVDIYGNSTYNTVGVYLVKVEESSKKGRSSLVSKRLYHLLDILVGHC